MEATQVAVVLDALYTVVKTALPAVEVVDGQPLQLQGADSLVLGWSANAPAVQITQERGGIARDRRSETLQIACVASCWRGDTDPATVSAVRAAGVALLNSVRTALAADRTLGGAVRRATLGYEGTLDQAQSADGASATFDFFVLVETL